MKPLQWGPMFGLFLGGGALGLGISAILIGLGRHPLGITGWLGAFFGLIAVVLWYMGNQVRRLKSGSDTRMTPLQAARVAAMARSIAINGAWFSGFLVAVSAVGFTRVWAPAMLSSAIGAGSAAVGALAMTAVAWVVERWCVDDSDSDQDNASSKQRPGERGAHGAACLDHPKDGSL